MGEARLKVPQTATADAQGRISFTFTQPGGGRSWVGTVSVLGASSSTQLSATVDAAPWGAWPGNIPSGSIQALEFEVLQVDGTGFPPGQTYTAWWLGADQDLAGAALLGPANPLSTQVNVQGGATLNIQHNDSAVATEPTVDFEDGGGVNWTLTDDPPNTRVKVAAAVSGGGAMALISSQVLGAAAASVTFSSIPQTFNHLRLVGIARSNGAGTQALVEVQFNGDTGIHYDYQYIYVSGASLSATEGFNNLGVVGAIAALNGSANYFGVVELEVPAYALTTAFKTALGSGGFHDSTATNDELVGRSTTTWRNTAAVTSLTLLPNTGSFVAGSAFYLYGIT